MKLIKDCHACAVVLVQCDDRDQTQVWMPLVDVDENGRLATDPTTLSPCDLYFRVIRHHLLCDKNEDAARLYVRDSSMESFRSGFERGEVYGRKRIIASMNGANCM
jgi:hypothetical protein